MSLLSFFKKEKNPLLGVYSKRDLLILVALILGTSSIILLALGKNTLAFIFMFFSGILHIASRFLRSKKSDRFENYYMLILEGVSSVVCFGVAPSISNIFLIGYNHISTLIVCGFYIVSTVVSIAYNVSRDINKDSYSLNIGLPVTLVAFVYPLLYLIDHFVVFTYFDIIFTIFLLLLGILYLIPIRINKITR